MQRQTINDAAQGNVGSTSIVYTYKPSGRVTQRAESGPGGNPHPTTWTYDSFGRTATWNVPSCASCTTLAPDIAYTAYDPQGQLLAISQSGNGNITGRGYTYTTRGEFVVYSPNVSIPATSPPMQPFFANGVQASLIANGYAYNTYPSSATWDPRSGESIAKVTEAPWTNTTTGESGYTTNKSAFTYDPAGRLTADVNSTTGSMHGNDSSDTLARAYDAENHTITSSETSTAPLATTFANTAGVGSIAAYHWGPTGHPIQIGSATGTTSAIPSVASAQYDTLHWDGDQLVFQTNSSGKVDDIKVGTSADITPLDPKFTGLTFWDRGPGGAIMFCHNVNGTSFFGFQAPQAGLSGCGGTYTVNGTTYGFAGPSTFLFGTSAGGSSTAYRARYMLGVGQGALLGMYRTDGLTDGINTLQGVRTMDANAGTWTTPDAYAGNVQDPSSQKSYMWNNNNPVGYSDPSGFHPLAIGPKFDTNPDDWGDVSVAIDEMAAVIGVAGVGDLDPGMTTVDPMNGHYKTLSDAAKGAQAAYSGLAPGHEVGCALYCTGGAGTCGYGPVSVGPKSVGEYGRVDIDIGPYRGDKEIGIWHRHPTGAPDDTTGGHAEVAAGLYQAGPWLDHQSFTIYTTLPSGLVSQRYTEFMADRLSSNGEDTPPIPVP